MLVDVGLVDRTWKEVGRKVRPLGKKVIVRTYPIEDRLPGSTLFLPPNQVSFYYGMPHQRIINAVVLSTGAKVKSLSVGDVICFTRLFFSRWERMQDGTFTGWVDEANILGYPEEVLALIK